jgi:hypothetical protein
MRPQDCSCAFLYLGFMGFASRPGVQRKVVLVTGSTDGVGRLVARRLADQGARVFSVHGLQAVFQINKLRHLFRTALFTTCWIA